MWIIKNNRLTNTVFTEDFIENPINPPYPMTLWVERGGVLTHGLLPDETPEKFIEKPYPEILWRVENNKLTHGLLKKYLGAFENAGKLRKIVIPESVKKIGDKSFSGTALQSVKIASDCEYSETSFPGDCTVGFYG